MPLLSPEFLGRYDLDVRDAPANINTTDALQVICAWPVSGQYGVGSRFLYYILVAVCVFARKAEWLRNAALAAVLLLPAIGALHGIALAAVHVDDAVDMDIYGAFQLCSIGILAAPITVRISRTYFYDKRRNIIFLWTILLLAGLLALAVEFYRSQTVPCPYDDSGLPMSPNPATFPYDESPSCGLVCNVTAGPFSPMRGGSANNLFVIPGPDVVSFGTATLLAAACCIPAILNLISMWERIREINWKTRFGGRSKKRAGDEVIEGTNGATLARMQWINGMVRGLLTSVEAPLFAGAVLALLVIGERNFFSPQVNYQTEPIASIGGWAPIVGTVLGGLGSLYVLLATGRIQTGRGKKTLTPSRETSFQCDCKCPHHSDGGGQDTQRRQTVSAYGTDGDQGNFTMVVKGALGAGPIWQSAAGEADTAPARPNPAHLRATQSDNWPTLALAEADQIKRSRTTRTAEDSASRRRVAKLLRSIPDFLGTPAPDRFDLSEFKHGRALDFPEIPGEENKNPGLRRIREQYNLPRDADGHVTPIPRENASRVSLASSIASGADGEDAASSAANASSPDPPLLSQAQSTASPSSPPAGRPRPAPLDHALTASSLGHFAARQQTPDRLEVPSPFRPGQTLHGLAGSPSAAVFAVPEGQSSPSIIVSKEADIEATATGPNTPGPTTTS